MNKRSKLLVCTCLAVFVSIAGPATSQSVRELREQVSAELQEQCAAGSTIAVGDQAMDFAADGTATVRLWAFDCKWKFQTHPNCGTQKCEVRTYRYENGKFVQTGAYLE